MEKTKSGEKNTYSVLMSVYSGDSPQYLKLAFDSIYDNQTKKPDEIIIVIDGPIPLELQEVINEFIKNKEEIVKCYPQPINRGLGEALRIGTKLCTGDYIFRMDADDISHKRRFEVMSEYLEQHPDIDVLGTNIAEFEDSLDEDDMRMRICPEKHEEIVSMSKRRNPMNHVTVCMKKTALEKSGGYESLLLLEDYYLWLKMIVSGCKLENLNEVLVYVRVGNQFNSKRGSKERITGWRVLQDYMLKHSLISPLDAKINMIYIHCFVRIPAKLKRYVYRYLLRK